MLALQTLPRRDRNRLPRRLQLNLRSERRVSTPSCLWPMSASRKANTPSALRDYPKFPLGIRTSGTSEPELPSPCTRGLVSIGCGNAQLDFGAALRAAP